MPSGVPERAARRPTVPTGARSASHQHDEGGQEHGDEESRDDGGDQRDRERQHHDDDLERHVGGDREQRHLGERARSARAMAGQMSRMSSGRQHAVGPLAGPRADARWCRMGERTARR
jgi:hypothetical protein